MIKNKKQYQVTKKRIEKLRTALDAANETKIEMPREIYLAMIAGVESQIRDMEAELNEYETLSIMGALQIDNIEELGRLLIKARIAKGLNQNEFAEKCGLKSQQIQKYEENDYASASLQRIYKLYKALGISFSASVDLQKNASGSSVGDYMCVSSDKITSEEGTVIIQETTDEHSLVAHAPSTTNEYSCSDANKEAA